jgi:GntR family transcriptional regulator
MTADLTHGGFLYRAVTEALRTRIAEGQYMPGDRIPSVEALAQEFNVSTITVRRAVRELALGGELIGRQGRGVFVTPRRRIVRSVRVDTISPIEEEMRANGIEPGLRELGMALVSVGDEPFLARLQGVGTHVQRLERVLLADDEPVGLDTLWLPRWLATRLHGKLQGRFILSQLADHNVVSQTCTYQAEATIATDTQAALLGVAPGSPLLVVRYFPIGPSAKPLLAGRTLTRADRFTYEFSGRGAAAQTGTVPWSMATQKPTESRSAGRKRNPIRR